MSSGCWVERSIAGTVDALIQSASKHAWRKANGNKGTGGVRNLMETLAEPGFRRRTDDNSAKSQLGKQMDGMELCATDMLGALEAGGPSLTPG